MMTTSPVQGEPQKSLGNLVGHVTVDGRTDMKGFKLEEAVLFLDGMGLADLGPGTIDVSSYPENIREDYKTFLTVCSACHTPARPINSSITSLSDWKRFVHRMHVKMDNRGYVLNKTDEKKIVNFLVFDSNLRKIKRSSEFRAQQDALKTIFRQVKEERDRLILEETKRLPKKEIPYVGVK